MGKRKEPVKDAIYASNVIAEILSQTLPLKKEEMARGSGVKKSIGED